MGQLPTNSESSNSDENCNYPAWRISEGSKKQANSTISVGRKAPRDAGEGREIGPILVAQDRLATENVVVVLCEAMGLVAHILQES